MTSGIRQEFDRLWRSRWSVADAPPVLLADELARSAAEIVGVAGVGITMLAGPGVRAPIGASDPMAALAERLQFTTGDGPCYESYRTGRARNSDLERIGDQWPTLCSDLLERTPYRSVTAAALATGQAWGSVDAYHSSPDPDAEAAERLSDVAESIAAALINDEDFNAALRRSAEEPDAGVPWSGRSQVWIATAMVGVALESGMSSALDRLRAAAYSAGTDVDEVAARIVSGRMSAHQLRG